MSELDYKESWAPKNWCFWTVVLEKTPESPLDCKEIQAVHPKGDQSWVFIGRTDIEAETPILWPPDAKSWLIWKDPDAGKDWGQEEKGTTEDEMVGWYHWLDGHGFGWTPGVGDWQGGLACCSSWGHKESDMTERLNWTDFHLKSLWLIEAEAITYKSIGPDSDHLCTAGQTSLDLVLPVWKNVSHCLGDMKFPWKPVLKFFLSVHLKQKHPLCWRYLLSKD